MVVEDTSFYNIHGEEITRTLLVQQMIDLYTRKIELGETKLTDFNEGSEIRNLLESFAVDIYILLEEDNENTKIVFIETAEGEWLDKHGANPQIRLPRETGEVAKGFVTFTIPEATVNTVVVPNDTIVVDSDSGLQYTTLSEAVIGSGENSSMVAAECLTTGADGNCMMGSIDLIEDDYVNVAGLSVTNLEDFTGGVDYEEDDEYRERLLSFVRNNDFGSVFNYTNLGESIDGVHDIYLKEDTYGVYTRIVVVNGDAKPVSTEVVSEVAVAFSDVNNHVLNHRFNVVPVEYVNLNLTFNLDVSVLIEESILRDLVFSVFDGGGAIDGAEFEGLHIGETLTRNRLYDSLYLIDYVKNVNVVNTGSSTEIGDLTCPADKVLRLNNVVFNQNVIEG